MKLRRRAKSMNRWSPVCEGTLRSVVSARTLNEDRSVNWYAEFTVGETEKHTFRLTLSLDEAKDLRDQLISLVAREETRHEDSQ